MAYAVKSDKIFKDFDNQIAIKNVLLENIIMQSLHNMIFN
jgi:hypothetical protein